MNHCLLLKTLLLLIVVYISKLCSGGNVLKQELQVCSGRADDKWLSAAREPKGCPGSNIRGLTERLPEACGAYCVADTASSNVNSGWLLIADKGCWDRISNHQGCNKWFALQRVACPADAQLWLEHCNSYPSLRDLHCQEARIAPHASMQDVARVSFQSHLWSVIHCPAAISPATSHVRREY